VAASGDDLRRAMRRFPAGVCVVTVDDDGRPVAATIGSLVSLALDPPLVGISVGHQSSLHLPLRHAGRFAASLLAGDQEHVARHFSRGVPPLAQWAGVERRDGPWPEPLVEGALAWLACRVVSTHEAGDHTLVVGGVEAVELGRDAAALVYLGGRYRPL
jgi:flavin reductase (DIM6/NTAB) family NADH-FMN oxidoreductase RutF